MSRVSYYQHAVVDNASFSKKYKKCSLFACLLLVVLAASPTYSQAQNSRFHIDVAREFVRFSIQEEVQEWRLEVFSPSGDKLFDSNFAPTRTIDWWLKGQIEQSLESGLYAYSITLKYSSGQIKRLKRSYLMLVMTHDQNEIAMTQQSNISFEPERTWSLYGNNFTNPTTQFIGTRDAKPLIFKTNLLEAMSITCDQKVGIGTPSPTARFEVLGEPSYPPSTLSIGSADGESLGFGTSYIGFNASRTSGGWVFDGDGSNNGGGIIYTTIGEGIRFVPKPSTGGAPDTLTDEDIFNNMRMMITTDGVLVAGTTTTQVLQITSGADLSEQFEVKALTANRDTLPQQIQPGLVVSIDPDNPGKLVVTSQAYDRRVAGIISGGGGVRPGLLMGQSGSIANGSHAVALTGRVYCWADASNDPISPGDLMTTSNIPGHAMKVTNHAKAQGAILGKAMSSLQKGRGLVLVLVTLQ